MNKIVQISSLLFFMVSGSTSTSLADNCSSVYVNLVNEICTPVPSALGICDIHCTCIHGANYGKCISYKDPILKGNPNIYTPPGLLAPTQFCTCDYIEERPRDFPLPCLIGNCPTKYVKLYPKIFLEALCTVLNPICQMDCLCAHGFPVGECEPEPDFCKCSGAGPLNYAP